MSDDSIWLFIPVNPEPWAIGTAHRKGISPNANVVTYQNAVREALANAEPLPKTYRKLTFYFFRQIERYITESDKVQTRNVADATNMQKALEDALQGILFDNDREVVDIRSVIVMQTTALSAGFTVIRAEEVLPSALLQDLPDYLIARGMALGEVPKSTPNRRWSDSPDIF